MTGVLSRRVLRQHRRLRADWPLKGPVGNEWTVLGSDVLLAALGLTRVTGNSLLYRIDQNGICGELSRQDPLFARLLSPLPSCNYIRIEHGIVRLRCGEGTSYIYSEEPSRPILSIHGWSLPEHVVMALDGVKRSRVVDLGARLPAIVAADPVIKRARNGWVDSQREQPLVDFELNMGWGYLVPVPALLDERLRDPPVQIVGRTPR